MRSGDCSLVFEGIREDLDELQRMVEGLDRLLVSTEMRTSHSPLGWIDEHALSFPRPQQRRSLP